MTTDVIGLIANLALTLSFIVGLAFGLAQVRAAARDRRERLTLETLRNYQSREFAELMQYVSSVRMPVTADGVRALPVEDQVRFMQLAQQMEMLGILVAERTVDMDLVDKTLGSFVSTSWAKYRPSVTELRRNDPFLAEYFQWLAESVEERMTKHPRRPFHESNGKAR